MKLKFWVTQSKETRLHQPKRKSRTLPISPHPPIKSNFNNSSEVSTILVATFRISLHCRPHSQNSRVHRHGNGAICKIMHSTKLKKHATNIYRFHLLTMISFKIRIYYTTSI